MKTLVISDYGVKISYKKGVLKLKTKKESRDISLTDLEQLVIATSGVLITSKAVRALVNHGVDLVFLDHRGLPIGRIYPPFINRTVETRRKQYLAYVDGDKATYIAKAIVSAKIMNQAGLLKRYYRNTGDRELKNAATEILRLLRELDEVNEPIEYARQKIISVESKAARTYWAHVSKLVPQDMGFEYRDQDSPDPFNTMLNYGYGILYSEAWKALVLAGLDPYAGFIHVDRSGKPTLAFDYVEMFRCSIVDYVLLKMVRKGWRPSMENGFLDYRSRGELARTILSSMDRKTSVRGEKITVKQALKKYAFKLASFIRGDTKHYEGFVEDW